MTNGSQFRKVLHSTAFAALLAAGILMAVLLSRHVGAFWAAKAGEREAAAIIGAEVSPGASARAGGADVPPAPEMRGVVEYLARRYRVAAPAVESLVGAARAAGERIGLDPMLIVAVMAIESGFNPIAESPLGAQGLMQVIPRYHQDKIEEEAARQDLLDPMVNIRVGARVLKESIRRAGTLEAGLQQYGGALSDGEAQYAARVLAEKQRLDAALRRGRQSGA